MIDKEGMLVLLVNTESPAWHAGLKVRDIIIEIDGVKVNNINDYFGAIAASSNKKKLVKIIRDGEIRDFEVQF